jgi:branched-chain amino acid transport system ATP-binding protein
MTAFDGSKPELEVRIGSVNYGLLTAVSTVSLELYPGEVLSILGPNGAGKTSLLKAVIGAVRTRGRQIRLRGEDCSRLPTWKLARQGLVYIPDGARCFPELTTEENLMIVAPENEANRATIGEVLKLFPRLKDRYKIPAGVLSGGERQMLSIARGLLLQPRVLLLDEPSAGLAPIVVNEVYKAIEVLCRERGISILLAEQNVKLAMEVSRRLVLLEHGKIVQKGLTQEFTLQALEEAYLGTSEPSAGDKQTAIKTE